MDDAAMMIGVLAVVLLLGAWRELLSKNHRDAGLLAVCAASGMMLGAAAWFS